MLTEFSKRAITATACVITGYLKSRLSCISMCSQPEDDLIIFSEKKPPFSERIKTQTNTWVSGSFKGAFFCTFFINRRKEASFKYFYQ
ncbi:hypothetical protein BLL41_12285 [Bacillus sp. FMQ74]|nr:hypothetical protein BLL41_12285 [Bacillus sp. FMQ74]